MNDPFARLGLPRAFAIDRKVAEKNHRELSRALHPDRYLDAPPEERRRALVEAADVNEAFRAIREPIGRAEALFRLQGVLVGDTHEPKPSAELLMAMMELREEIDAARDAKSRDKLRTIGERVRKDASAIEARISDLFPESGAATPERARAEVGLLGELRFYLRALETLDELEEQADDDGKKW